MNLAFGTPTLVVRSNRGLPVRMLTYNRTSIDTDLDERIERTVHDACGRIASRIDARLFTAGAVPNFVYTASLAGRVLRTAGVDAGVQLALADVDGRPVWARDGRGTVSTWAYDPLGRPLSATDTPAGGVPAVHDAWIYGEAQVRPQAGNLRGRCVRRYDTAGRLAWTGFRLTGQPLTETRTLLTDPDAEPDWQGDEASWAEALEPAGYATAWSHDATGAWHSQIDAKGNVQAKRFDVAGRLAASSLTLAGGGTRPVLATIDYSAAGQVLRETAGNGVASCYMYEPETLRLARRTVTRPVQSGRKPMLQDLRYTYDPVGNVTSVRDAAQPVIYWRNQRVEPACTYVYDALYQLTSATGREMVNCGQQGTTLPPVSLLPADDTIYAAYMRCYAYDRGGNLTRIQHQGGANFTQGIVVSGHNNHALAQNAQGSLIPTRVDDVGWFDAAGNQQNLLPDRLQPLVWNSLNRLREVTLVQRDTRSDREAYQYGGDGMRVRKHTASLTSGSTRMIEAIYLPGLTLRVTRSDDGRMVAVAAVLQEIRIEAGRASVQALRWDAGLPQGVANDAFRYDYAELIGSIGLELDAQGDVISREEYYPYGGTAVWTARSQMEADTRYRRYSGKERDATGLYDYGWRSYQPWIGRWLNPDPAGVVDGLNLYRMVRNSPVSLKDIDGLAPGYFSSLFKRSRPNISRPSPSIASEPEEAPILRAWERRPERLALVHSFNFNDSPFSNRRASDLFDEWDIVSASLVDLDHLSERPKLSSGERKTYIYKDIAFVLDVPAQNILGTFAYDVWFPNHAGRENNHATGRVIDSAALTEAIFSGRGKDGRVMRGQGGYEQLDTPENIWSNTISGDPGGDTNPHNEILLIGRPGIQRRIGVAPTGNIKVSSVLYVSNKENYTSGDAIIAEWTKISHLQEKLLSLNPGITWKEI
ncbi:RHS repeat protein [Burkholderia sp. LS-044]|uniref:RHS repeat-associated core domain-containing protein n=1 Tax=Burkholderia sp. LS-044 TaxID=1459967 RepID=UPI0010A6036F|nr:RHS repeat-associated core domain-containing protein [Burkholderia sp. LS-044]THJ46019.1 RHS repeat protein [Burkholderia sp. LS-044]